MSELLLLTPFDVCHNIWKGCGDMEFFFEKIYENFKLYLKKFCIWIVGLLLLVHILYKIKTGIWWIESEWTAGDLLSFIGTVLSFIGTMLLGCITVKLSKDSNEMNSRLVDIENKRAIIERDERLGYVLPGKVELTFLNRTLKGDKTVLQWGALGDTTKEIKFHIKMDVTANSNIHKINNTKSIITRFGDLDGPYREHMLFYESESSHACSIDLNKNYYIDSIYMEIEKDSQFYDMKYAIENHLFYRLQLEYMYENTLGEHRKVIVSIMMQGDKVIESGLLSVE